MLDHFKNVTAKDNICSQDYDSITKFPIQDEQISHLLPSRYQDTIVRITTSTCLQVNLSHM
ncbi:hypothetical protein OROHE_008976 [Orobanche hederae]